jgi:anaphase-promoting complex subunit 6
MCNLRGLLMLKLNRGDQAKACFMEALALDIKCYDAFEQLVGGEMMTLEEGVLSPFLFYRRECPDGKQFFRVGICSIACV